MKNTNYIKKIIYLLLSLVLVVSIVSCSNNSKTSELDSNEKMDTQNEEDKTSTEDSEETEKEDGDEVDNAKSTVNPPSGFDAIDVKPEKPYKIAFANWNSTNSAAAIFAEEMEKAAEYYGVEILIMDNKQDPIQAVDNFNNAATWGAEYYIQYNEDPEANLRIGEMLTEQDIGAIAVQVPLGDEFPYYRLDPATSGYESAKPLAEKAQDIWGDDVEFFLCLDCPEAGAVIQDRADAAVEAVQELYPDIKVVRVSSEGDPEVSRNKVADALTANPQGKFMFWGHMDQWTLAGISAIKAANRYDECIVSSVMGLEPYFEELQVEGTPAYGTVAIRPEVWAWEVLPEAIRELNTGEKAPKDMYQPCIFITKDNLAEYYPELVK